MAEQQKPNESQRRRDLNAFELVLAQLYEHKKALKQIQSMELKGKKKAEFLPEYMPYVDGVIGADHGETDEIVSTMMIWSIDAGDIDTALRIGAYVMAHKLPLPDSFGRTTATGLAEEIADHYLKDDTSVTPEQLSTLLELVDPEDMPDQVRSKLYKAYGLSIMEDLPAIALKFLKDATRYNDRAGVKKQIAALEKQQQDVQLPQAEAATEQPSAEHSDNSAEY